MKTQSLLKLGLTVFAVATLFSCAPTMSQKDYLSSQGNQQTGFNSGSSVIKATSAQPSTGNVVLDFTGGIASAYINGLTQVKLSKVVSGYEYNFFVYFNQNGVATHVSMSWTSDRAIYQNAFSTSPAGVVVNFATKKITFTNTLLSSGLPSVATINGTLEYK